MLALIENLALDPLLVLALILGLVEFLKRLGLEGNASLLASMGLGLLLGGGYAVSMVGLPSEPAGWFGLLLIGLMYGLAASGLFDLASYLSKPNRPA